MGKKGGRPRLFKSRKELCEKIESYFESVGAHVVTDSEVIHYDRQAAKVCG